MLFIVAPACATFAAFIFLYLLQIAHSSYRRRKFRLPDGPNSLLGLGTPWTFHKLNVSPHETSKQLASQWGDMTTLWLGSSPAIYINSPEVAQDLLHKNAALTASRPTHNDFRTSSLPSRIVVTPAGESFRNLRKLYNTLLQRQNLNKFQTHSDDESKLLLLSLFQSPANFRFEIDRYSINTLFRAIYNVRLGSDENGLIKMMYKNWEQSYLYFLPGTLPFDFFPSILKLPKWLQPWRLLVKKLKQQEHALHAPALKANMIRDDAKSEMHQSFAATLLQSPEGKAMSNETRIDTLGMVLGAGSDTTSAVLQIFLKVAALYPEETAKAQAEIDSTIGPSRLPTFSDEKRLPYLRAYIKELQRWAPIAPVGIPHATTSSPLPYRDYLLPPGTILIPNIVALNRNPAKYSNRPDEFWPERYLGDEFDAAASSRLPDFKDRDHYHFGFGRRFCPGSHVGEAMVFIVVARVLWGFNIGMEQKQGAGARVRMEDQRMGLLRKPLAFHVDIASRGRSYEEVLTRELPDVENYKYPDPETSRAV